MADTPWSPRSGFAIAGGYMWLPRLVDKARCTELGEYVAFEKSPADMAALKAWKVTPDQFRAWVAEGLDEEAIADRLAAHLGHDEAGRRRWTEQFRLVFYPLIMVLEADEGRVEGPLGSFLRALVPPILFGRRVVTWDWS